MSDTRYKEYGVRGLWFLKTKKPFPVRHAPPIFNVAERGEAKWTVSLHHPTDWENEWSQSWARVHLSEFVQKTLKKALITTD